MDALVNAFRQIDDALDEQLTEIRLFRHSCRRLGADCAGIGRTLSRFDRELTVVAQRTDTLRRLQDPLMAAND
jgi:hypothetical protein